MGSSLIFRKHPKYSSFKNFNVDIWGIFLKKKKKNSIRLFEKFSLFLTKELRNFYKLRNRRGYNNKIIFKSSYNVLKNYSIAFPLRIVKKYKYNRFFLKCNRKRKWYQYRYRRDISDYIFSFLKSQKERAHFKRFKRLTEFGKKLKQYQQFRFFLGGIPRNQVKKYLNLSLRYGFNSMGVFLSFLEARLDVFVFRLSFFDSILEAKQNILHGKVLVNNNIVKTYNIILKSGDVVSLVPSIKKKVYLKLRLKLRKGWVGFKIPSYIEFNSRIMTATLIDNLISLRTVNYAGCKPAKLRNLLPFLA